MDRIVIYDRMNRPTVLGVSESDIESMSVEVIAGDEKVHITTFDNRYIWIDSNYLRQGETSEDDTIYSLNDLDAIHQWNQFNFNPNQQYSKQRTCFNNKPLNNSTTISGTTTVANEIKNLNSCMQKLVEIEKMLSADCSGIDHVRSAKSFVGSAMLLIDAARREITHEMPV